MLQCPFWPNCSKLWTNENADSFIFFKSGFSYYFLVFQKKLGSSYVVPIPTKKCSNARICNESR